MAQGIAAERWRQLRPLLDRALDLQGEARARFLNEISAGSQEMREQLERLLQRQADTAPVDKPAAALAGADLAATALVPADRNLGRRVGAFRLTALLGCGGMGAVYVGERIDGAFQQRVAIKLMAGVHPGLSARFQRERQILADLRHPHIAQLIDGGETEDGMPYFALEYVQGTQIGHWADANRSDVRGCLRLLLEVAQALDYAHRQGVIHRDIKPGNIMVTEEGHAKLLDFGIARLLNAEPGETLTRAGVGPMTPDYAAPEQFEGSELGPSTDIYQFGVLMFRLLGGRLPYEASPDNALAWARAVSRERPLDLARLIQARQRSEAPAGARTDPTAPALWRQLHVICTQALAKQPRQRQASMAVLIGQLRSCLEGQSLPQASLAAWSWRAWSGLAAVALLLIMLSATLVWQWRTGAERLPSELSQREQVVLDAFGLTMADFHASDARSAEMIFRALQAEARGDVPAALAMFETAHQIDPRTPLPAMLMSYWGASRMSEDELRSWHRQRDERLALVGDPQTDLLARFLEADVGGDIDASLRYSQALLELRPQAWFLRLARGHWLSFRGSRPAALHELQQIDVPVLAHRRLADAIPDRAALGDLAGAQALASRLVIDPLDPFAARLSARLAYSAGDLRAARDGFVEAARLSHGAGLFVVEARAWLWAGVFSGSLGEHGPAIEQLRRARATLDPLSQRSYAVDANCALAQLHAMAGDQAAMREDLELARAQAEHSNDARDMVRYQLSAARLDGQPIPADAISSLAKHSGAPLAESYQHLIRARQAIDDGDRARAQSILQRALDEGIAGGVLVEEAALLARELDLPLPPLEPIDPPFGPYTRFAARWALGQGLSVVPPAPVP